MKSKETKDIKIEQLLEREKTKNRRIITAVLFAAGILIGTIFGYFLSVNVINNTQAKVVNSIQLSVKNEQ